MSVPYPTTCAVCGEPIAPLGGMYHARLDVSVHGSCLDQPVKGEDISMHTMRWLPPTLDAADE